MKMSPYKLFMWISLATGGIASGVLWVYSGWSPVIVYVLVVNALVGALYIYDKAVAGKESVRVPEMILHSLTLLGGGVGATLAQTTLRHKTKKPSFLIVHWFIILTQISLFAYLIYTDRIF